MKEAALDELAGIVSQEYKIFEISVKPRSATPKEYQGDGIVITINFTLHQ
jgi:hypothetical protein